MKIPSFDDGNVINLVTGYPAQLKDWTQEDISRGSKHVWECIRPRTQDELAADLQPVFTGANMTSDFQEKVIATLMRGTENSLALLGHESGERLQIPHLFADGSIVIFNLRMQSEAEVAQAFIDAQYP